MHDIQGSMKLINWLCQIIIQKPFCFLHYVLVESFRAFLCHRYQQNILLRMSTNDSNSAVWSLPGADLTTQNAYPHCSTRRPDCLNFRNCSPAVALSCDAKYCANFFVFFDRHRESQNSAKCAPKSAVDDVKSLS